MPRSPGRPPQTSRAQLRDLARAMFAEQGFDGTSLASIARAAGVSRTTLFSYFPSKRDLMWEEYDERLQRLEAFLVSAPRAPVVSLLTEAIQVSVSFRVDEHDDLARRMRIVDDSAELRAYTALRSAEISRLLVAFATSRASGADPQLLGDVTHALMAVASRATRDWAATPAPEEDLDQYAAARLAPFAGHVAALLEE
ncbi:TetR family transcriptional regulator [Brachybacterium saurashtrense]|nr:TetR family transcriptional regulator [Brachybacterium saurashtrense]